MIAEVAEQDRLMRQAEETMRTDRPIEEVRMQESASLSERKWEPDAVTAGCCRREGAGFV